jgi:hypothetical protein
MVEMIILLHVDMSGSIHFRMQNFALICWYVLGHNTPLTG